MLLPVCFDHGVCVAHDGDDHIQRSHHGAECREVEEQKNGQLECSLKVLSEGLELTQREQILVNDHIEDAKAGDLCHD